MPRATTTGNETERFDLKTCPGGFVVLRRLTYGEYLKRRQMASNMSVRAEKGQKDFEGVMELVNQKVTEFEFANCIVEHNLEDDDENILDFANPVNIRMLDPRIGEEISTRIDEMNQYEPDLGN